MIEKETIRGIVEEFLKGTDLFLVSIKTSADNRITVLADKKEGISIDDCAALHRYLESKLDRDKLDFELQVSSPGLNLPFMVIEQYYKNEGRKVEVTSEDGSKYTGILRNVNNGGFELETEVKVKGKAKELKEISFNYDKVKLTRVLVTIK